MEWVASILTPPPNVDYPALFKLMRTPWLPAVDWTDAPTDLNGLVRFGERRNLVSARVPSRSARAITMTGICSNWSGRQWTQFICIVGGTRGERGGTVVNTVMDRDKFPYKLRNISLQEGTCFLQWGSRLKRQTWLQIEMVLTRDNQLPVPIKALTESQQVLVLTVGWDSAVGIVGRSGDRIPVEARFSAPVQVGHGSTQPPIQWEPGHSQG